MTKQELDELRKEAEHSAKFDFNVYLKPEEALWLLDHLRVDAPETKKPQPEAEA